LFLARDHHVKAVRTEVDGSELFHIGFVVHVYTPSGSPMLS
jgi:hypothetical protein